MYEIIHGNSDRLTRETERVLREFPEVLSWLRWGGNNDGDTVGYDLYVSEGYTRGQHARVKAALRSGVRLERSQTWGRIVYLRSRAGEAAGA
jgi:hypothetical protein